MVIDFIFNEQYLKTYTPEAMKTEVFDFYFGGFRDYNGKRMVLLRRLKKDAATELNQIKLRYNGEMRSAEDPLRMHVEGVVIDNYFDRDSWNVIITIPAVKTDGNPIEAVAPGVDFTDEELYGLDQVKGALADFGITDVGPETAPLFNSFLGSVYFRLLDTMHKCKSTAYGTDRGLLVSVGVPEKLRDEGSYCVKVYPKRIFSGAQYWLCRYPIGRWKENKNVFREKAKGVSPNARGSKINVKLIFEKRYIMPDDLYEYKLFNIQNNEDV